MTVSGVAMACLIIGILIAANFDISPRLEAQSQAPTNIFETGAHPVVERNGRFESPFVAVVEQVTNAVVNISARTRGEEVPWWHRGTGGTSSGSGFFFNRDGYVLTNNHVIDNATRVTVRTSTGFAYDAEVIGTDPETDLAVLKVEPEEEIAFIPLGNSDSIKVGDWAIAIGNPFPQHSLDRTVTVGVISARGRSRLNFGRETPQYQDYIQTDASINPGNSGGPLLNLRGECIGINAAISSPTGTSVGIGFAIPVNIAKSIIPDLIEEGRPRRGWLGVYFDNVTEREARRQGLEEVRGVMIDSVFRDSPAERAGIKPGDIIIRFHDQPVDNTVQLSVLVSTVAKNTPVPIEVVRERERIYLDVEIIDRDAFMASLQQEPELLTDLEYQPWLGMELVEFTPDIARATGVKHVNGVYVSKVIPGSPADRSEIAKGTIILQVNREAVSTLDDVERVASNLNGSDERIPLIVQEPDGTIARKVIRP